LSVPDLWTYLSDVLRAGQRFLLTSHVYPEGDSIGSEVALALHLRHLGKHIFVANDTPLLERYAFLGRLFPVGSVDDLESSSSPENYDVAICLDVSNWDYTGRVGRWIQEARPTVVSIDHHHRPRRFGDLDVVLPDASSTGEVLYRYFRSIGAPITPEMAEALYASLLFDTGGFRLSNAGNETVRVAHELLELGADHRSVCAHLFEVESWSRIHLLRLALGTLQRQCGGRLAWLSISNDLFRLAGAEFIDGDGILDHLLGLKDVEICVMFRQLGDEGIKATFRSKGGHDVGRLAEALGGGGRATASGVLLAASMHESIRMVLPRVHRMLEPRGERLPGLVPGATPAQP
jgi:phosphoesterase RecJ-like protein